MTSNAAVELEVAPIEQPCPDCGEMGLYQSATPARDDYNRGARPVARCWACGWSGDPIKPATGYQPAYADEEVEEIRTTVARGLHVSIHQLLVPALLALPGLVLLDIPEWRAGGAVWLIVAYLVAYQVGTWPVE